MKVRLCLSRQQSLVPLLIFTFVLSPAGKRLKRYRSVYLYMATEAYSGSGGKQQTQCIITSPSYDSMSAVEI